MTMAFDPRESTANSYDLLITDEKNDCGRYESRRTTRNDDQKQHLLNTDFAGFKIDTLLRKLIDPDKYPGVADQRHCLVFWARPPPDVKDLVLEIQKKLKKCFPRIWYVPQENLHMTTMEITHSRREDEIAEIIAQIQDSIPGIVNFAYDHRARLIKPKVGFDDSGLALTFVPAAGECLKQNRTKDHDKYTYHHLRRDLFVKCTEAGADVQSRYVVETAHVTIARFVSIADFQHEDHEDHDSVMVATEKVEDYVKTLEDINCWLEAEYWPSHGSIQPGGEWIVGESVGLDLRNGTPWYGGGKRVAIGKGF